MTKREMYNHIATVNADDAEIVAFCEHEVELLSNRKSSKSPTKTQKANEELKAVIAEVLSEVESPVTVTELLGSDDRLSGYTNQKVSALLRQMVEAGTVEKTIDGKKARFALA